MNEYKIILKALSTLAVNHSLEAITGALSLNQITDQIAHYIYHYNGGFCEYYR